MRPTSTLALVAGAFALYALISRRLHSTPLTGPMLFVAFGLAIGTNGLHYLTGSNATATATPVFEATLVLVLFTDAMSVNTRSWRTEVRLPTRLLGIGLPLTIAAGCGLAALMFGGLSFWEAALVGAILAPTDAALGLAVVSNAKVPELIRQALNVESGLNDGIVLPFITVFLVFAEHEGEADVLHTFLVALVLAAIVGAALGWCASKAVLWAAGRGWIGPHWQQLFLLAVATLSYAIAVPWGGSGFIAAWVAGCAMGLTLRDGLPQIRELSEDLASLLTSLSFLLFGAIYLGPSLAAITAPIALYAVLSLSVVRMVPVSLSMVGTGLGFPTVAYVGWFGPRGLASIVFADFIVEHALPGTTTITAIVNVTVFLSVLVHGATSYVGSQRYAAWCQRRLRERPDAAEGGQVAHLASRRRIRQQS